MDNYCWKVGDDLAMFFHGIDYKYLTLHYPVLSPRQSRGKNKEQLADRRHLIEKFGVEPVHLLEYIRGEYTLQDCLTSCFEFGDVVLAFRSLPLPFWQLSRHEIGVVVLDMRLARWIFTKKHAHIAKLKKLFPHIALIEVSD
nr:hypothetical protein [Aneurinibacillus terranovensis]